MHPGKRDWTYLILLTATVLLLAGRAYQHLLFEGPYRAFFLDENFFGGIAALLTGKEWVDYVTSLDTDRAILMYSRVVGVIFAITAVAAFLSRSRLRRLPAFLLPLSFLLLFFMAFCYYLDRGFQGAQFIEYSAQVLTPLLLALYAVFHKKAAVHWLLRIAVGLTFLGHGLYALGFHPVPGHFVHMVISNLGLTNDQAIQLLLVAGWLDVGVAIGVLIPKMDRYWLAYAVFWGFLTALARLTTYVSFDHLFWISLHQMGFEFLIRTPHFLLPLAGLAMGRKME